MRGVAMITVAETTNRREAARHFILTSTWLMDFILVDATLLLVWIGVRYGLRPLVAVRTQIESRSPRELRPLETSRGSGRSAAAGGCSERVI